MYEPPEYQQSHEPNTTHPSSPRANLMQETLAQQVEATRNTNNVMANLAEMVTSLKEKDF